MSRLAIKLAALKPPIAASKLTLQRSRGGLMKSWVLGPWCSCDGNSFVRGDKRAAVLQSCPSQVTEHQTIDRVSGIHPSIVCVVLDCDDISFMILFAWCSSSFRLWSTWQWAAIRNSLCRRQSLVPNGPKIHSVRNRE